MAGKILKMKARKPSFEVGASQPLSFGKKKEETPKVNNIVGPYVVPVPGSLPVPVLQFVNIQI